MRHLRRHHAAVSAGRNCLVLTRWIDHLNGIAEILTAKQLSPLVLHGQMGNRARKAVTDQLTQPRTDHGMLLAATASLLGEGFDCPPLDTLFLAFPISFKGSVVQYVGRILRPTDTKTRVEVHDYVDILIPTLVRMHNQRRTAYTALGFQHVTTSRPQPISSPRLRGSGVGIVAFDGGVSFTERVDHPSAHRILTKGNDAPQFAFAASRRCRGRGQSPMTVKGFAVFGPPPRPSWPWPSLPQHLAVTADSRAREVDPGTHRGDVTQSDDFRRSTSRESVIAKQGIVASSSARLSRPRSHLGKGLSHP